jgi:NADPH-dependent 2,4-dienoyl-CoA reductase/sulfur reductase-like enzyme
MTAANNLLQTKHPYCQVVVGGAGPTGLILAAHVLASGITTRIIDKGDWIILENWKGAPGGRNNGVGQARQDRPGLR